MKKRPKEKESGSLMRTEVWVPFTLANASQIKSA